MRRVATRSAAQHGAAQHVQAGHARQTHSAHTCTCVVHSRAVLSRVAHHAPHSLLWPIAWRFFVAPDRTWRFFLACAGLLPCAVAAGLSFIVACAAGYGCLSSVLLLSPGGPVGARGRFLDDRCFLELCGRTSWRRFATNMICGKPPLLLELCCMLAVFSSVMFLVAGFAFSPPS